jgi:hypothetical protein
MTDDVDRLLRAEGERWQATVPPPPDVATALRRRHRRVRRTQVLSAAAAVLIVAGGLAATIGLLGHGDQRGAPPAGPSGSPSASPSSTAWPAGAVPWVALPATHPTLPSTRVPASPDPADAAGVRACTTADIHASRDSGIDGAAGTDYLQVRLTLVGTSPCRLEGYPTVRPLGHGRVLDVPVETTSDSSVETKVEPVLVTAQAPALIRIGWAADHSCPVVDNDRLSITLPGSDTATTVAGFGTTSCNPGEGRSSMEVWPVRPLHWTPAHRVSPYDGVTATGNLDLTARAGQPLDFAVTLTSKQDLPLDPCPDYSILIAASESSYALDCAAVPHHDAQGRPYLPAGVPVTFAMRADPGDATTPRFVWRLTTPDSASVLVVGLLTVTG